MRAVRGGFESGPAARVAREHLVGRAQGRDQDRISLARARSRRQNFGSPPDGRKPQWKLQAQCRGFGRIDAGLFSGGQSCLKSAKKCDRQSQFNAILLNLDPPNAGERIRLLPGLFGQQAAQGRGDRLFQG